MRLAFQSRPEQTEAVGVDVGADHRAPEPRHVVSPVDRPRRHARSRCRQRFPHADTDVVEPGLAGHQLQAEDQRQLQGVVRDVRAKRDPLPGERAAVQLGGRPGLPAGGDGRRHELDAVPRLGLGADVLGLGHRREIDDVAPHLLDRQRQVDHGGTWGETGRTFHAYGVSRPESRCPAWPHETSPAKRWPASKSVAKNTCPRGRAGCSWPHKEFGNTHRTRVNSSLWHMVVGSKRGVIAARHSTIMIHRKTVVNHSGSRSAVLPRWRRSAVARLSRAVRWTGAGCANWSPSANNGPWNR